jgi:O-antigen/teichoic acid export membrane protein
MSLGDDLKRLFKHSSIYTIGGILNRVGAFLLLPLYTNHLTPAEYGTLELVYSTSAILSSLLSVGMAHATLRFYFEYSDQNDRRRLVCTTLIGSGAITVAGAALLAWTPESWVALVFGFPESGVLFRLALTILVLELSTQIGYAYFRAREYSRRFVLTALLQLVIQVSANYYTVAVLGKGVEGVLTGNLLSVAVVWLYVAGSTLRECGIRFDAAQLRRVLAYSAPFLLSTVVSVVLANVDRFLLKAFYSLEAVGLYALAAKFIYLIDVVFGDPFKNSYGAFRFSVMQQSNAKTIQSKIVFYIPAVVGFLALGLSGFTLDVLKIFSDSSYWGAAGLIPILGAGAVIGSVVYPFQTGILYAKKTRFIFYVSVITGLFKVAMNLALIPFFGAVGAAAAVVLASAVNAVSVNTFSQRLYPVAYRYGDLAKMGGVLLILLSASGWLLTVDGPVAIPAKAALLIAYPILLLTLGCFEEDERRFMRDTVQKFKRWLPTAAGH